MTDVKYYDHDNSRCSKMCDNSNFSLDSDEIVGLRVQQPPKKQVTTKTDKKGKAATLVTCYAVSSEKRMEPDPVKATLEDQVETQEVPPSSAGLRIWKFLICNSHQPVHPWSTTTNGSNRGAKKTLLWRLQQPRMPQTFQTGLPYGKAHYDQRPAATTMDDNDLGPNAGKTYGNNGCDNSNFAMPCTELAYLTRTAMHAFTPPDTPAKRGKLVATVAGRDLPARQLQHSGHSEGDSLVAGQFLVPCASSQSESFEPSNSFVAEKSFVHCNSAIVDRVLQSNSAPFKAANQPASTTFKSATVTKMATKQGSASNEKPTKSVTRIRATRKQESPTIKEGMAIKNVIESGSTSAPEIMAHDPWLASNTPSSETNKHVVPPERTHLTDPS